MNNLHKHYGPHQLALLPALHDNFFEHWQETSDYDLAKFASFLGEQRMHGFWLQALQSLANSGEWSKLKIQLNEMCKTGAALELPQQRSMQETHELLAAADVPYFFAKGAQLRQVIYRQPWHRPAVDVDVFIDQRDKQKAISTFQANGFSANINPATISHEIDLRKFGSHIDLHWHLMRPSRYRQELDSWLFHRREHFSHFWGLDATASLLVMLTHPPITKYLISPTSMLIHQVDQLKLIEGGQIEWESLGRALHDSGLKTAAWSSVYLLKLLTGYKIDSSFEQEIRPGLLKRRYIQSWINNAWISRLFHIRWLVATGFNLALQDSVTDTIRAVTLKMQERLANSGVQ